MFFQEKAKVTRLPWMRTMPVVLLSLSPTAGLPATGTSLRPLSCAARKMGVCRARAMAAFRSWVSGAAPAAGAEPAAGVETGIFIPGMPGIEEDAGVGVVP